MGTPFGWPDSSHGGGRDGHGCHYEPPDYGGSQDGHYYPYMSTRQEFNTNVVAVAANVDAATCMMVVNVTAMSSQQGHGHLYHGGAMTA
jgi:hypothetical protein